jgi:chromosome segregation ATPase
MKKCKKCGGNIKNEKYDVCWKCNNPSKNFQQVELEIERRKYQKVSRIANQNLAEADRNREEAHELVRKVSKLNDRIKELEDNVKTLTEENTFLKKSNEAFKKNFKELSTQCG